MARPRNTRDARARLVWSVGALVIGALLSYGARDMLDTVKGQVRTEGDLKTTEARLVGQAALLHEQQIAMADRLRAISDRMSIMDERQMALRDELSKIRAELARANGHELGKLKRERAEP